MAYEELLDWACDKPPWQQDTRRTMAARLCGVNLAFSWMSTRASFRKLVGLHLQFPRSGSIGQPIERSQLAVRDGSSAAREEQDEVLVQRMPDGLAESCQAVRQNRLLHAPDQSEVDVCLTESNTPDVKRCQRKQRATPARSYCFTVLILRDAIGPSRKSERLRPRLSAVDCAVGSHRFRNRATARSRDRCLPSHVCILFRRACVRTGRSCRTSRCNELTPCSPWRLTGGRWSRGLNRAPRKTVDDVALRELGPRREDRPDRQRS